jgi:Flp pilus assembly protein TadB
VRLAVVWCSGASVYLLIGPLGAADRLSALARVAATRPTPRPRRFVDDAARRCCVCVAALMLLGWVVAGPVGLLPGVPAGLAVAAWIGTLESPDAARLRAETSRDLPLAVDLLSACSSVGRTPQQALPVVSRAVGGTLGARLAGISTRLDLGADPSAEWARLVADPLLADLGRAMQRSSASGAPLAAGLSRLADDLRRERRTRAQMRARSVGVKAAGPLAACFLPAFMIVGVVPMVAGSFQRLFG